MGREVSHSCCWDDAIQPAFDIFCRSVVWLTDSSPLGGAVVHRDAMHAVPSCYGDLVVNDEGGCFLSEIRKSQPT